MSDTARWFLQACVGIIISCGQAWLVWQNLVNSKPYKITYLDGFYSSLGYVGVPIALVASIVTVFFLRHWFDTRLSPFVPVMLFPILFWMAYKVAFVLSGHELNWEGGSDFSTMSCEADLAYQLITC